MGPSVAAGIVTVCAIQPLALVGVGVRVGVGKDLSVLFST